jgi:colicin import membrane protein
MGKASRSRRRKGREKRHAGPNTATERPSAPAPSSQSAKPAADGSHEDAFFARGEENTSFPPSSVDAPEAEVDETAERRQTPEVIERRARLRRVVTWIVGAAAVLTALVSVKALLVRSRPRVIDTAMSVPHQVVASIAMAATEEPASAVAEPSPTPESAPAPAETAPAETAPTAELDRPAEKQPAEPSAPPAPSKADVRHLIERGNMKGGIAAARTAIEADPSDAETYLLLGAALQELGQWKESMGVFTQCVDQATKGPKNECRALRGH